MICLKIDFARFNAIPRHLNQESTAALVHLSLINFPSSSLKLSIIKQGNYYNLHPLIQYKSVNPIS